MKITKKVDDELLEKQEFTTLDELLNIRFVKEFTQIEQFEQFSFYPLTKHKAFLMSEHARGKGWWVVGTIDEFNNENLNLPAWNKTGLKK